MNEPWENKKNKIFKISFDFEKMEKLIDDMMKNMSSQEISDLEKRTKPLVMGFSIKMDSSGQPKIEEFGNVKSAEGKPVISNAREPLVDVINSEESISIIAELPGVEKKDIKVKEEKNKITLSVDSAEKKFFKEIALDEEIIPKSAKASFKNGVLEVVLKKARIQRNEGEIKIE